MTKITIFSFDRYQSAINHIQQLHHGQIRKFTLLPYYTHPLRVASLVAKYKHSHRIDDILIAALYHDTLEDTDLDPDELRSLYGEDVADLVLELTSRPSLLKSMGKTEYLKQRLQEMSSWALVIKLCDRLDNILDFVFAPEEFVDRYGDETKELITSLWLGDGRDGRPLTNTQGTIINDINSILSIYGKQMDFNKI